MGSLPQKALRLTNYFHVMPPSRSCQSVGFSLGRFFFLNPNGFFSFYSSTPKTIDGSVAIFWDLDNKPPDSFPPYDAAVRLKKVASTFGVVRFMVAYANSHAFRYVPTVVREQRRERKSLDRLETKGVIKSLQPYLCRVCGRKFNTNDKLINHFKQLHEREQIKRLNRLNSSRGNKRVQLAAKMAMKIDKYKNAARDLLVPKVGYGLADELKRAGFWVRTVSDRPQAADAALKDHMLEKIDQGLKCLVLVSDDSDFVDILREARMRSLRTVVVGDNNDGALRRVADAGFSWKEIALKKAKKEAVSTQGYWNDRDILKKLEWTYKPISETSDSDDYELAVGQSGIDDLSEEDERSSMDKENAVPWWKIESDSDSTPSKSFK